MPKISKLVFKLNKFVKVMPIALFPRHGVYLRYIYVFITTSTD